MIKQNKQNKNQRAEINEIENRETIKTIKPKAGPLKRSVKLYLVQPRTKEKLQITSIRNVRGTSLQIL